MVYGWKFTEWLKTHLKQLDRLTEFAQLQWSFVGPWSLKIWLAVYIVYAWIHERCLRMSHDFRRNSWWFHENKHLEFYDLNTDDHLVYI